MKKEEITLNKEEITMNKETAKSKYVVILDYCGAYNETIQASSEDEAEEAANNVLQNFHETLGREIGDLRNGKPASQFILKILNSLCDVEIADVYQGKEF